MTGPVFDCTKVIVFYVLGGPGAGKGTQCGELVKEFGFCHLSAGDLLRAEHDRIGSPHAEVIKQCMIEGQIVPMEVTVSLLENAMREALDSANPGKEGWTDGRGRFLIDGFPRKMDQAMMFEQQVCVSAMTLFFHTTEEVMLRRIMTRGETSGRVDDNIEVLKKRFGTYEEQTMPVIGYFKTLEVQRGKELGQQLLDVTSELSVEGKVATIDSTRSIGDVDSDAKALVYAVFDAIH